MINFLQCPKCYHQLYENEKSESGLVCCPNCNTYINLNLPPVKAQKQNKVRPRTFIIIYAAFMAIAIFLPLPQTHFGAIISNSSVYLALATIATGFAMCPNSRAIKVLFWINIALIIMVLIVGLLFVAACIGMLNSCM